MYHVFIVTNISIIKAIAPLIPLPQLGMRRIRIKIFRQQIIKHAVMINFRQTGRSVLPLPNG